MTHCEICCDPRQVEKVFFVVRDEDGTDIVKSGLMCYTCIMANCSEEDPLFSNYAAALRYAMRHDVNESEEVPA